LAQERVHLKVLADALVENEELDEHDIERLIGPSVNKLADSNGKPPVEIAPAPGGQDVQPTLDPTA
jgi:hypothetical protein